jgi:acetyl-CoA carboxylase carboxyl transferase subunit alpha
MGTILKAYLLRYLRDLTPMPVADLLERRYQKFRRIGVFDEGMEDGAAVSVSV